MRGEEAHVEVGKRLQLVLAAAPDAHGALLRDNQVAAALAGARVLDDLNHVAPLPPPCTRQDNMHTRATSSTLRRVH